MTDNPRDTHFQCLATLLAKELIDVKGAICIETYTPEVDEKVRQIIARRAYDFACHVLYETGYGMDLFNIPDRVQDISDMTEW